MKKTILILLIILALFIGFFPYLASTRLGTPFFAKIIQSRFHGNVQIQKVNLTWKGPQRFENISLTSPDLTSKIGLITSNVPFWKLSDLGDSFELQNGSFAFPSYGDEQISNIQAKINGSDIVATGTTARGGSISVRGSIKSKQNFDLLADLREIPSIAIDQLLKMKGILYKTLGPIINFNGSLKFQDVQGTLVFDVSSPNLTSSVNATIANDILTLNKPLVAHLHLSNELSAFLTERISPKLFTDLSAKNPFHLTIDPQGFSCPINPLKLAELQIGEANLDLGQVRVQSGESLHFLVKLFKNKDFGKKIEIWFTPVTFSIQNGLIQLGRMDALLSQSIHVCTWGDINLQKDKIRMTLGLPADTLEQSFGIQNLSRNYVLKIPIRGSLNNPEFETGPAVAKIATMATAQQIPTTGGKIFGGIVGVFAQAQDEGDTPPPHRPYPWEK